MAQINISFLNEPAKQFFHCTSRNSCLSGGYGSTKTYTACEKIAVLSTVFNNYKWVIGRQVYKDLIDTTFRTFMKIMPESFIAQWNQQNGYMRLKNNSEILWRHLDAEDESTVKGLEVNSVYIDQPEEISEQVYTALDARVSRWDRAIPNFNLVDQFGIKFEKDTWGNWKVPSYMLLTPNPDTETHWIWRYYHPDSNERLPNHAYFEVSSLDNPALSPELLKSMLSRDPQWVRRYVYGKWGISEASIHTILPHSEIEVSPEFMDTLLFKGAIYRVLDHGDSSPTACTWWSVYKKWMFCFQEYNTPGRPISYHRRRISELSEIPINNYREPMYICGSWADPDIFKQKSQKDGGFWSVAQEYNDSAIEAPTLTWMPADNNELATRNRINELLMLDAGITHPITGESPAPQIYFVKPTPDLHKYGIIELIKETRSQRRIKHGEINGRSIYTDERDDKVTDHLYDTLRYFIAMHGNANRPAVKKRKPSETSFAGAAMRFKALKEYRAMNSYGDNRSLA